MPSSNALRNLAGSVRRFLSSIVCSYSPRSMGRSPCSTTMPHYKPQLPTSPGIWTTLTRALRLSRPGLDAGLGGSQAGRKGAQERLGERRLGAEQLREATTVDRQCEHLFLGDHVGRAGSPVEQGHLTEVVADSEPMGPRTAADDFRRAVEQ